MSGRLKTHLAILVSHHAWQVMQTKKSTLCYKVEHAFERFELAPFAQALQHAKLHYFQTYELSVSADFCMQRTVLIDAIWHGQEQTLDFLEEVRAEVAHEFDNLDTYFIDARPFNLGADGLEVEVFLLSKITIHAYLQACQVKHLRLRAISIAGEEGQGLNLFPWRQQQFRHQKILRYLRICLLPVLFFLMTLVFLYYENALLDHQQEVARRLQKQETKYREAESSKFSLGEVLPVLESLNGVEKIQVNAEGQIKLFGFSTKQSDVTQQIQAIGEQNGIEKNSLHDLSLQEEKSRTAWQVSFQVARTDP